MTPNIPDESGSKYEWSDGQKGYRNTVFNLQNQQDFTLTVTSPQGCVGIASYSVGLFELPAPTIKMNLTDICGDGKTSIDLEAITTNGTPPRGL